MRVDLFGLTVETPGVTFYLWSPWRCSALEHRLFDAVKGVAGAEFEPAPDELRVHVTEPKGWKVSDTDFSRNDAHGTLLARDVYCDSAWTQVYLTYVDNYLVPQTEGWMNEGVLAGYGLYVGRYAAGRPWASLLVLGMTGVALYFLLQA